MTSQKLKTLKFFALASLLIIPIVFQNTSAQTSGTDKQTFDQQKEITSLTEKAESRGIVHVIVELKTKFVEEETLKTQSEKKIQHDKIKTDQNSFLKNFDSKKLFRQTKFESSPYVALSVDKATFDSLVASSLVKSIREDFLATPSLDVSIPWIGADDVHALGFTGSGRVVAVLDTGFATSHPALSGRIVDEACFSTSIPAFSIVSLCPSPDGNGDQIGVGAAINCSTSIPGCDHGTHVAGIAVGNGGTVLGVAPGASLMPVNVFSRFNNPADCLPGTAPCIKAFDSDIIMGLDYVRNRQLVRGDVASVNLSLGGGSFSAPCAGDPAGPSVNALEAAGVATVAASGNEFNKGAISSPGCVPGVFSVGATTTSKNPPPDTIAAFSNSYASLTLLAPGDSIRSAVPGGGVALFSGTSMATPHIAGSVAVLKSANTAASVDNIRDVLTGTGVPLTDVNSVTTPRVQLDSATTAIQNAPLCPDPISTYDILIGTAGPDYIIASMKSMIFGGSGNDQLVGSADADCIFGESGADKIRGKNGADKIFGGMGADQIGGGAGADNISGEGDADRITGDDDGDTLSGGDGNDSIAGRAGMDTISGGNGNDRLSGGTENDTMSGDNDDDQLAGHDGDDSLDGGPGNDICNAGPGTNTVTNC